MVPGFLGIFPKRPQNQPQLSSIEFSDQTKKGETLSNSNWRVASSIRRIDLIHSLTVELQETLANQIENAAICEFQARKKAQRLTFWVRRPPVWWGSSTRRGGGRRVRALPRKFVLLGFEEGNLGCPGDFAGMSRTPESSKSLCNKKFVRIFRSLELRCEALSRYVMSLSSYIL